MSRTKHITIVVSILLILIGVGFYFGTGRSSVTAMIPAFFGVPLLLCGLLARGIKGTIIAMHVAVLIAALGTLGAGSRLAMKFSEAATSVIVAQSLMLLLCGYLTVTYVRSFIKARKMTKNPLG